MRFRLGRSKRKEPRLDRARAALGVLALAGLVGAAPLVFAQPGPPPGRGPGAQGAPGSQGTTRNADRALFHQLLDHRQQIQRTVTERENGVETLTESDDPEVAKLIVAHVESMKHRLEEHRPIHRRDPLFAAIFQNADEIDFTVTETDKGVRVVETSSDPAVVALIQAHAKVVTKFLENGYPEMRRNHAVPARPGVQSAPPVSAPSTPE